MAFKVDLPNLIATDLTSAFEKTGRKGLGTGSYEAPGQTACFFIVEKTKLGGGQSIETSEFPFQGGWGTRSLNRKVQTFTATVSICGRDYMGRRNALVEALDQSTDDDSPGTIELPSWGRLPVVVQDWEIEEENQKQGLATFSLTFVRAGLSVIKRTLEASVRKSLAAPQVQGAAEQLKTRSCIILEKKLPASALSPNMLRQAFSTISGKLQELVGRVQAAKMVIEQAAASVQSLISLIAQGVSSPKVLALAMFGAYQTIASAVLDLLDSEDLSSQVEPVKQILNGHLNGRNVLLQLMAEDMRLDLPVGSSRDAITLAAVTAVHQAGIFYACGLILPTAANISQSQARDLISQSQARDLFALFVEIENRIDRSDPDMYWLCSELRSSVNDALSSLGLESEKTRELYAKMPVLPLSSDLGVSADSLENLNQIEDQHAVIGKVLYV